MNGASRFREKPMNDLGHKETPWSRGWRAWVPGVLLSFMIGMSALFYAGGGMERFYGPAAAEREAKKQELRASRIRLTLQLAKCRNYGAMKSDAYICGGSSLIYQNLESSLICRLAEEVAQEQGVTGGNLSISSETTSTPAAGT